MTVRPDRWIREMSLEHGLITPFVKEQVRQGVLSYGPSSYGYDIRLADEFKIFVGRTGVTIDPKHFDPGLFTDYKGPVCIVPRNSFVLARSLERFKIPRRVLGLCVGKSSLARCGLVVNITPLEPGWEGHLTIAIHNTAPAPAKVYAGEGIAQVVFFESDEDCILTYAERQGRYQGQTGITLSKV